MAEKSSSDELERRYGEEALAYLRDPSEQTLYHISLLSKRFMRAGLGPEDLLALHASVVDAELERIGAEEARARVGQLDAVALEAMIAYGAYHREIGNLVEELRRSQKELRDSTAMLVHRGKMGALGELSASIVHEINQPLNAIKLTCQDVQRTLRRAPHEDPELAESIDEVVQETRRMAEIVDGLRRFGRRDADSPRRHYDLRDSVQRVLRLVEQQLTVCGVSRESSLPEPLMVLGDRVQLEQVVMNLVSNARDAVQGLPQRTIRIDGRLTGDDQVELSVSDTGPGIAEELRSTLFEPFVTTKAAGSGTGLGLSLSRQIAEAHGGSLQLDPEAPKGARFVLRLPAREPGPA
ncbi:MAG: ATP-binding protein [Myxococcales bacterium]|nr:ATP-binding protein [Myxococcales bacterium]